MHTCKYLKGYMNIVGDKQGILKKDPDRTYGGEINTYMLEVKISLNEVSN